MTESVLEALENKASGIRQQASGNCAPPLPVAEEGGEQFAQRSENARISASPQRFPGTASREQASEDAETDGVAVGDAAPGVPKETGDADCHDQRDAREACDAILACQSADWSRNDTTGPVREMETAEGPDPAILTHLRSLQEQAEELKREFPDFDLDAALHNPAFLRLTAPALGVGVREAFYALNRPRLDELAAARAAEASKALLARAVSGGAQRPREGGGSGAAALLRNDYAALSRPRQLALKQRIREAAARGEKMYP